MKTIKRTQSIQSILEEDDAYAQLIVDRLIHSLVKNVKQNSKLAYEICNGFERNFDDVMDMADIEFPTNPKLDKDKKKKQRYSGIVSGKAVVKEDWEAIFKFTQAQTNYEGEPQPNIFVENVQKLAKKLNLSQIEADCLIYIDSIQSVDPAYINFIADLLKAQPGRFAAFIALGMDKPDSLQEISKLVSPSGKLSKYGIISFSETMNEGIALPQIDEDVCDALYDSEFNQDDLIEKLIGKPIKGKLSVEKNFPHLMPQAQAIATAIRCAIETKTKGFNVLLHGPVGSGKTELAYAIAELAGLNAYAVGEDPESNYDDYGDGYVGANTQKRLPKLKQAQRLLEDTENSVAVFDEIEDLLIKGTDTEKKADTGSKIDLNRVLEDNLVPTILIANDADKFHSSFHSRIKLPLFVGYQPTLVRQKIWQHHIKKYDLKLGRGASLKLARAYDAPPRVIAHACETTAMLEGGFDEIKKQIRHKSTLSFNGYRTGYDSAHLVPEKYNPNYLSSSTEVQYLEQIFSNASNDRQPLSLLIEGERKVGKSSLAYYLAEQSMRHVSSEDMADMIIPGQQTEPVHHVSIAFAKASKMDAIMVIENFDKLFANENDDREKMIEVFMDEMESHRAPVVLIQSPESKMPNDFRAFMDLQVKLGKLDGQKLKSAFRNHVGSNPPKPISPMPIGDIVRASHSVHILDFGEKPSDVVTRRIAASMSTTPFKPGFK